VLAEVLPEDKDKGSLAARVLAWAGIRLSPAVGSILMSVSTVVVGLNAQLLRRVRLAPDQA